MKCPACGGNYKTIDEEDAVVYRCVDCGYEDYQMKCMCGSGEVDTWAEYDAQGIYLCKVCKACRKDKLSKYRPEILTGYTQEDVDEPLEEE